MKEEGDICDDKDFLIALSQAKATPRYVFKTFHDITGTWIIDKRKTLKSICCYNARLSGMNFISVSSIDLYFGDIFSIR